MVVKWNSPLLFNEEKWYTILCCFNFANFLFKYDKCFTVPNLLHSFNELSKPLMAHYLRNEDKCFTIFNSRRSFNELLQLPNQTECCQHPTFGWLDYLITNFYINFIIFMLDFCYKLSCNKHNQYSHQFQVYHWTIRRTKSMSFET